MSISVKFAKPTPYNIAHVAEHMRKADANEVWAMSRQTPCESIIEGVAISDHVSVAIINGEPCAVFGLVVHDLVTGTGVPWLLGTDHAVKHRRVFLEYCKTGLAEMLDVCPNLFNYVHADNTISVRWLKFMGFTIHDPESMGPDGELFHKFSIGDI